MRSTGLAVLSMLVALAHPVPSRAGCGCAKPPPPLAAVRPFAGFRDMRLTLFDSRLVPGTSYQVQFVARDGTSDWSTGRATWKRDLADVQYRAQLRVKVGTVSLGPCSIKVWNNGSLLYALTDDQFTLTAPPIPLHDYAETVTRPGYQAGVGSDGTMYVALNLAEVTSATTFVGSAAGYALGFSAANVIMYNAQGFLMQMLDPTSVGLFQIRPGDLQTSSTLSYWRHEFATYKADHRQVDAHRTDDDPDWHADGTYHVDHDTILVAIYGTLASGARPTPGLTPPFQLQLQSIPSPVSPL